MQCVCELGTDSGEENPDPAAEEPAWSTPSARRRNGMTLQANEAKVAAEERRRMLAELRANGVEHVERDGRTYTLLRLPGPEERRVAHRGPLIPQGPSQAVGRVG